MTELDITKRSNLVEGLIVDISVGEEIVRGVIKKILSKNSNSKGIKVELMTGEVGCVKYVPTKNELRLDSFKYWNSLLQGRIFTIYDNTNKKYLEISRLDKFTGTQELSGLLFSSKDLADEFVKNSSTYNSKQYTIRTVKSSKTLSENFPTATSFRGDIKRKISAEKLNELQYNISL